MKYNWLTFSLLVSLLLSCSTSKQVVEPLITSNTELSYTITPNLKAEKPYLLIEFSVKTNEQGELYLAYPNDDWGQDDLFNSVSEITTFPVAKVEIKKENNQIFIKGKSNQSLKISYQISQDFAGKPMNENAYRPQVNTKFFHVFGKSLFMIPKLYFDNPYLEYNLTMNWSLPNTGFEIVNSFGAEKKQVFATTYDQFSSSIFMGGELNTKVEELNNQKVVFSTPDKWEHIDIEQLNQDLNKIIQQQRTFWNDYSQDLQTVTLVKTHEECPNVEECNYSVGGTGLTNSFACMASDNLGVDNNRMNWLFSHELFHHWLGDLIRNQKEEREYWFSEGFTDYYSYKLLLRNDMMTPIEFINKANTEVIKPHYSSPIKNAANNEITVERFWSDYQWEKLPYQRGWLYAFYLDAQIKNLNAEFSLDDVMRNILKITKESALPLNEDVFLQALEPFANPDFRPEFTNYIENGQPIDLREIKISGIYFAEGDIPYMMIDGDIGLGEIFSFLAK